VAGNKRALFCWLVATELISSAGCAFILPGRFWRLNGDSKVPVTLITDSPEVRRLLDEEDAREEEVSRFFREPHSREDGNAHVKDMALQPDQYPPGRSEFLKAMSQMPGISVTGRSYCELIERTKSKCGASPIETAVFVLVRVTTGPSRGKRGWICQTQVQQQFP
jgi:hypothetical protein